MFREWLIKVLFGKRVLQEAILMELQSIHYHADEMRTFYMMVNNIEEDDKEIRIGNKVIKKEQTNEKQ